MAVGFLPHWRVAFDSMYFIAILFALHNNRIGKTQVDGHPR